MQVTSEGSTQGVSSGAARRSAAVTEADYKMAFALLYSDIEDVVHFDGPKLSRAMLALLMGRLKQFKAMMDAM